MPDLLTAVYIDLQSAVLISSGEAQLLPLSQEEFNVSQPQDLLLFTKKTKLLEVFKERGIFLSPGIGAAVKGILAPFHTCLIAVV